jgi:CHASE1-domain containing sensor protein/class 3 adenylate cyclase
MEKQAATPKSESPGTHRGGFGRRSASDADETIFTTSESESSSYHYAQGNILYRPNKSDILPLVIIVLCSVLCLAAALLSYFLVKSTSATVAYDNLETIASQTSFLMQHAIDSTQTLISETNAYFSVTNGVVTNDSFLHFVYGSSDNGVFPENMQRLYYIEYIPPQDVDSYVNDIRQNDGYENFTITARNSTGKAIPYYQNQTMYLPVVFVSPILPSSLSLLGFDHYSDPTRVPIIDSAISSRRVAASTQLVSVATTGPVQRGVLQYSPVFSQTNGTLLGFVVPVFQTSVIFINALSSYSHDAYASVFDMNATNPNDTFMYNTYQYRGSNASEIEISAERNAQIINNAPFTINFTINFADRLWMVTIIPTQSFLDSNSAGFTQYIGIVVAVIVWLISICVATFLFYYKRLHTTAKMKRKSELKLKVLSKFIPSSFLELIRSKSFRQYVPGWNHNTRVTLMAVVVTNFNDMVSSSRSESIMNYMNDTFIRVKTVAKKNDGFIHRYEGLMFTVLFTNETKAVNAAITMQAAMREGIEVHVVLHNAVVLAGIMGDADTLMTSLVTDHTDILKKLSILCKESNKKVIMSREVVESFERKKSIEKMVTYVGRIETLPVNGIRSFTDAYQLLDDADPIKPAARKRYGVAMKKMVTRDYIGALDLLDVLVESDISDENVRKVHESTSRTVSLCKRIAEVWDVHDTLKEKEVLRPAFENFCKMELSIATVATWKDLREFSLNPSKDRAYELFAKYCIDGHLPIKDELIRSLEKRIGTGEYDPSLFADIVLELEGLVVEAHNRFKRSPMFLNGMYSIMVNA